MNCFLSENWDLRLSTIWNMRWASWKARWALIFWMATPPQTRRLPGRNREYHCKGYRAQPIHALLLGVGSFGSSPALKFQAGTGSKFQPGPSNRCSWFLRPGIWRFSDGLAGPRTSEGNDRVFTRKSLTKRCWCGTVKWRISSFFQRQRNRLLRWWNLLIDPNRGSPQSAKSCRSQSLNSRVHPFFDSQRISLSLHIRHPSCHWFGLHRIQSSLIWSSQPFQTGRSGTRQVWPLRQDLDLQENSSEGFEILQ